MNLEPPEHFEFNQETFEAILAEVKPSISSSQYVILKNAFKKLFWFQKMGFLLTRLAHIFDQNNTENLKDLAETITSSDDNSSCEAKR